MNAELRKYRALAITLVLVLTTAVLLFSVFLRLDMGRATERMQSDVALVTAASRGDLRLLTGRLDDLARQARRSEERPEPRATLLLDSDVAASLVYACLEDSTGAMRPLAVEDAAFQQGCPASVAAIGKDSVSDVSGTRFLLPAVTLSPTSGKRMLDLSSSVSSESTLHLGLSTESLLDVFASKIIALGLSVNGVCLSILIDEEARSIACRGANETKAESIGFTAETDDLVISTERSAFSPSRVIERFTTDDLTWEVEYLPDQQLLSASVTATPLITLAASLSIGALVCWFVYTLVDKNLRLESQTTEQQSLVAKLEVQNNELDQFAVMAAHDLQAPLRFMSAGTHTLKEELEPLGRRDLKELADTLIGQCARMRELVLDLNAFCRAGHDAPTISRVDVGEVVDAEIERIRADPSCSDVSIKTSGLPQAFGCDRDSLLQIIHNLVANAVTYARDENGVRVTISAVQVENLGGWTFRVEDDGPGIDPAHHAEVFLPFRRLDGGTEGTGIGLAIVTRLVSSLRGRIWIDEDNTSGCTFCFFLPDHLRGMPQA